MAPPLRRFWDHPPITIDLAPARGTGMGTGMGTGTGMGMGTGRDLVLSFASIGHDPTRPPSPEFLGAATAGGRAAAFIADASRSWANAPGFAPAIAALGPLLPVGRGQTLALGVSMGGFAALVAASLLPVDVVLAIGPQFSLHPDHMPGECRWPDWTARIDRWAYPTAPIPARPWIILMHGLTDDAEQARAFPERPGLDHLLFPDHGHSGLAAHLKARGLLPGLIEAALAGDRQRLLRLASSAGGLRRATHPGLLQPDPNTPGVRG